MDIKTKRIMQNTALVCASVILCLLFFELTIRFFIKPSPKCYGLLFNKIELPPFKLSLGEGFQDITSQQWDNLVVDGKRITKGDIKGIMKEDPVSGYSPMENAVSQNGWWRSNNLGARSAVDIAKNIPLGKQRVIIFGDSFTNCNGIPGEYAWPFILNNKSTDVEFFNFGVPGYSMGQCLLRYETLKNKVDYNIAMLVFVPTLDLWREINTLRQLNRWKNCPLVPRFIVQDGHLVLVNSPYGTYDDFRKENNNGTGPRLKKYLQAYDRLYFSSVYGSPPFWGNFISYKLLAKALYDYQKDSLLRETMGPKSEAMEVTLKIFEKMNDEAKQDGRKFILAILPPKWNIFRYRHDVVFRDQYDEMVSSIEKKGFPCINLMDNLLTIKPSQIDKAYDEDHNGPKFNKIISDIIWRELKNLKLIDLP